MAPIAVVGAGPAGLTCSTYLTRLGYRNVTVYESGGHAGGLRYVPTPQPTTAVLSQQPSLIPSKIQVAGYVRTIMGTHIIVNGSTRRDLIL